MLESHLSFPVLSYYRCQHDNQSWVAALTAILGRMSTYTGKEVTWEKALNSQEDTMPARLSWDMDLPVAPVAVPGKTAFV